MTVTVGVPFCGDVQHLRQCVDSLLAQTHDDLRVLVIGDGQDPQLRTVDERVDVLVLPQNRGAYFARAVALEATNTKYHAVVDSDDWVEPHWLETMLGTGASAVQHGSRFQEREGRETEVAVWKHARRALAGKILHYTSHTGVYETERLRQAGGYSPAYRVGYDSFFVAVLRVLGEVAVVDEPLYHRRIHRASLTQRPETRIGAPVRLHARAELDRAYRKILRVREHPAKVERIIARLTPEHLWDEVRAYAERVNTYA